MNKKFLNSDEEYFKYCEQEGIGSCHRMYYSTSCDWYSSEKCDKYFNYKGECFVIYEKPTHYPCVMNWILVGGDYEYYYVDFTYLDDFNKTMEE
jgi:hypothetical protein